MLAIPSVNDLISITMQIDISPQNRKVHQTKS